jgi:hypothetical protein
MKDATETATPTATVEAPAKTRKPRATTEKPAPAPALPLYKNTIKVAPNGKMKKIIGEGTIKDLAEELGWDVPPAHGLVKGLGLLGMATVVADKTAPKPSKGRTSKVYRFNAVAAIAPAKPKAEKPKA